MSQLSDCGRMPTHVCVFRQWCSVAACREDHFNGLIDQPSPRGCTFQCIACLPSPWLLWAVWRPGLDSHTYLGPVPSATSTAGGTEFDTPLGSGMDNNFLLLGGPTTAP